MYYVGRPITTYKNKASANHAKQSGQHFLAQILLFSRMDWWILLIVSLLSVYSLIMVQFNTMLLENRA